MRLTHWVHLSPTALVFGAIFFGSHPACADIIAFDLTATTLETTSGGTVTFTGTVSNSSGADLQASDFFFNFFGFDSLSVTPIQDLGISTDFLIPNGTTSTKTDLFDVAVGAVPAGSSFPIQVQLQDINSDFSSIGTATVSTFSSGPATVPEPASFALVLTGLLLFLLVRCAASRRKSQTRIPCSAGSRARVRVLHRSAGPLVIAVLMVGIAPAVKGQSVGPAFSTQTPESGLVGNAFIVLLPLANNGAGAASHVVLTSVTLTPGNAALTSAALPRPFGTLNPGSRTQLTLQFESTQLLAGRNYLLTVRGTYQVGTATLGFAVSRILQVTVPDSTTQVDLQRWAAIDAVEVKLASLAGLDTVAIAQAMLTFLQSRPEFVQSGIAPDSSSIWGEFADGDPIIIANDRPVSSPAAAARRPAGASPNSFEARQDREEPAVASTFHGSAIDTATSIGASLDHPRDLPNPAGTDLPMSSTVQVLTALPGSATPGPLPTTGYVDTDVVNDLTSWLTAAHYKPATGTDASVANLKMVGGEGVFYIATHGDFFGNANAYSLMTTTSCDFASDVALAEDRVRPTPNLVRTIDVDLDSIHGPIPTCNYAITSHFVTAHWKPFSPNSLIYIDACEADLATDFKNAILAINPSIPYVYLGWTYDVEDGFAADTARLIFDRMLGANQFCPEDGLPCAPGSANGTGNPPIFAQRPFDWGSVMNVEFAAHNLGKISGGQRLNFIPVHSPTLGPLAPSIEFLLVDNLNNQLHVIGTFGSDPRTSSGDQSGAVSVGTGTTSPSNIVSWQVNEVVAELASSGPSAGGDVVVSVRNHMSNVARLTEWAGAFQTTVVGGGSLTQTDIFNVAFRADIRQYRPVIHQAPIDPIPPPFSPPVDQVFMAGSSEARYACSGGASVNSTLYEWFGSGQLAASYPTAPIFGTFGMLFGVLSHTQLEILIAHNVGGVSATCGYAIDNTTSPNPLALCYPPPFGATLDEQAAIQPTPMGSMSFNPLTDGGNCNVENASAATPKAIVQWDKIPAVAGTAPDPASAR